MEDRTSIVFKRLRYTDRLSKPPIPRSMFCDENAISISHGLRRRRVWMYGGWMDVGCWGMVGLCDAI